MSAFGLGHMAPIEKQAMIDLILSGGPWSNADREAILDYCEEDVCALARLLPAMLPQIIKEPRDLERALLRGRYVQACARMEHAGIPISLPDLDRLKRNWDGIKIELIREIDKDFGVFDGTTFKLARFDEYLSRHRIRWPRTATGRLSVDDDVFRQMARAVPEIAPLRELRHALGQLRLNDLAVGPSGRNRTPLWPFGTKTGRNAPSSNRYIFGSARWLRSLIKPEPGMALGYFDWKQQEIAVAAALSGDAALLEAVQTGDPYLAFAVQAGLAPADATARTHEHIRSLCKACVLGIGYGMGVEALASRIGKTPWEARHLLDLHKQTYRRFWAWSQSIIDQTQHRGHIDSAFGWQLHLNATTTPRTLRNFPAQSNGAEMLRLACILGTERGLEICGPIHDAIMVAGPIDDFGQVIHDTRAVMAEASRMVLQGLEAGTDVKVVTCPGRYADEAGLRMWDTTQRVIGRIEARAARPEVITGDETGYT